MGRPLGKRDSKPRAKKKTTKKKVAKKTAMKKATATPESTTTKSTLTGDSNEFSHEVAAQMGTPLSTPAAGGQDGKGATSTPSGKDAPAVAGDPNQTLTVESLCKAWEMVFTVTSRLLDNQAWNLHPMEKLELSTASKPLYDKYVGQVLDPVTAAYVNTGIVIVQIAFVRSLSPKVPYPKPKKQEPQSSPKDTPDDGSKGQ